MRTVQHKIPADHFLAIRPPVISAEIRADYDAVRAAVESGVSAGYQKSLQSNFRQWERFCAEIGLDPLMQNIADPVPFLQFFAHRVRTGRCATRGKQVQKRAVEHYVRAVGQTIALLGPNDPRRNAIGEIDFRLARQLRSYQRTDPPPRRVKPLPTQVLDKTYATCIRGDATQQCIADMLWIAFFFLMRPGEYCNSGSAADESHPFRLCDVTFRRDDKVFNAFSTPLAELISANHVALTFTTQKKRHQRQSHWPTRVRAPHGVSSLTLPPSCGIPTSPQRLPYNATQRVQGRTKVENAPSRRHHPSSPSNDQGHWGNSWPGTNRDLHTKPAC